jgi:hypothetical protein
VWVWTFLDVMVLVYELRTLSRYKEMHFCHLFTSLTLHLTVNMKL